jgi:hypothetical protein
MVASLGDDGEGMFHCDAFLSAYAFSACRFVVTVIPLFELGW